MKLIRAKRGPSVPSFLRSQWCLCASFGLHMHALLFTSEQPCVHFSLFLDMTASRSTLDVPLTEATQKTMSCSTGIFATRDPVRKQLIWRFLFLVPWACSVLSAFSLSNVANLGNCDFVSSSSGHKALGTQREVLRSSFRSLNYITICFL